MRMPILGGKGRYEHPVVSFPHMGHYAWLLPPLAEIIGAEVRVAPPITRRTLEIGSKHSPEFVCVPFKYNLGNFIESLEGGANILIQAGGGCRFGYYGEIQRTILKDLGYDFDFIQLQTSLEAKEIVKFLYRHGVKVPKKEVARLVDLSWKKVNAFDDIEDRVRKRVGFEQWAGSHEKLLVRFRTAVAEAPTIDEVHRLHDAAVVELDSLPIDRPENPLRVGIVGELYVLMEPFSNMQVEKELAKRGVEIHRFITVSELIDHAVGGQANLDARVAAAAPYLTYHVGADGTDSVAKTLELMNDGFDGIVHLKPFGCMPEVTAMSALQRISRDHTFPILFMSYDAQTSETGVLTRIEAFCDMLSMRRKERAYA
jgi:predicted nucleotide-binding protein (sugar kinase/HSP70/actin superfamily)